MNSRLILLSADIPQFISRFSIFGRIRHTEQGKFVYHTGIITEEKNDCLQNDIVHVTHMRPPLQLEDSRTIDVAVSIDYTSEQIEQLETFLEMRFLDLQYSNWFYADPNQCYILHPCIVEDSQTKLKRYSCVGFVIDFLSTVDINPINIYSDSLPCYTLEELQQMYPHHFLNEQTLQQLGLSSNREQSWSIILPGYVINGLVELSKSDRFVPQKKHAYLKELK